MELMNLGVIGCGDFLRWQEAELRRSGRVRVTHTFDLDAARAQKWAEKLDAKAAASAEAVIADAQVDAVVVLVPPWARRDVVEQCAAAGKHVLTTKPLAPDVASCDAMIAAVAEAGVRCGVLYNRTANADVEALKALFTRGDFGRLALYKQDWVHHYPQWNAWATDPDRNGGPFMDAMIHNLNTARYLMGRPVSGLTFFSDNHAHLGELRCADTEAMKLDFEGGGAAHLFITWAADLAVHGTEGNDREHVELFSLVTDRGWRITKAQQTDRAPVGSSDAGGGLVAARLGEKLTIPVEPVTTTAYDAFARCVADGSPMPATIPTIDEAAEDIRLIRAGGDAPGARMSWPMGAPAFERRDLSPKEAP